MWWVLLRDKEPDWTITHSRTEFPMTQNWRREQNRGTEELDWTELDWSRHMCIGAAVGRLIEDRGEISCVLHLVLDFSLFVHHVAQ